MIPIGQRELLGCLTLWVNCEIRACCYPDFSCQVASFALRQPDKDRDLGQLLMQAKREVSCFGYRRCAV